ncbi:hypothetical protein BBJ29_004150 [Phytophthora kernoviae]|uniref:Complex 1 LYR protein domain-containing protein n=1 Tax=Phytophthora kernoviae TaxID=325452 RepID=A0A3F2RN85_9STRA|nr:hypothetical protein BBJ29_004150 [Phytophthora kernoviae]RLN60564.1 hypothetical protein BBP00_00005907 [Phytophthora kernoviae]
MKAHSGLQRQVLTLYKKTLQAAKRKDADTLIYVRDRFREDAATVDRKDFVVIEYMLRKGERDLKMLERMKSAHFTRVAMTTTVVTATPKTFETRDAELEPESELGSILPPEELETPSNEVSLLLELLDRSPEELSEVDALTTEYEPTEALVDIEMSVDKLVEEEVDTEEEAENELPELDNDNIEPEFEDDNDVRSVLSEPDELEVLVDESSDDTTEVLETSPAETDPEPELDECRAVQYAKQNHPFKVLKAVIAPDDE